MTDYVLVFAAGFAGSFHCLGMCGGFVCALGGTARGRPSTVAVRHVLYNMGRVTTYVFIGALAGMAGQAVTGAPTPGNVFVASPLGAGARVLAIVSGGLMVAMALQMFGVLRRFRPFALVDVAVTTTARRVGGLLAVGGTGATLALGALNGFLPCPLVYAFALQASATFDPLAGMAVMAAFGLATFPAMLAAGAIGKALAPQWRSRTIRLAGGLILALGAITVARGLLPLASHAPFHA